MSRLLTDVTDLASYAEPETQSKWNWTIAFYSTGHDTERGETSTGGRLLYCWNRGNEIVTFLFLESESILDHHVVWSIDTLDLDKKF